MNTLRVSLPLSEVDAGVVKHSLELEMRKQNWHRSETQLEYNRGLLTLSIDSTDPTALRAAANTNLRLLMLAVKLI